MRFRNAAMITAAGMLIHPAVTALRSGDVRAAHATGALPPRTGTGGRVVEPRVQIGPHRIYVREHAGAEPAIVLMHGFPDNLHLYDRLVPELAGRRLVLFDFVGWGRSDKPREYAYTFASQEGELAAVVDELGLEGFVLVGHDASGPAAINFALDHPERVAGLVLLNSFYDLRPQSVPPEAIAIFADLLEQRTAPAVPPSTPWSFARLGDAIAADRRMFRWLFEWQVGSFFRDEEVRRRYLPKLFAQFTRKPSSVPAFVALNRDLATAVVANTGRAGELASFTRPVRIVFGASDPAAGFRRKIRMQVAGQEVLRRANDQDLEILVESSPDVLFRLDTELRHLFVTRNVRAMTGRPAEALLGRTGREAGWPAEACAVFEAAARDAIATHATRDVDFTLGDAVYRARLVPELAPDGTVRSLLGIAEDVTAARRAARHAEFVGRLSQTLSFIADPDEIIRVVTRAVGQHVGCQRCYFGELDEATHTVTVHPEWRSGSVPHVGGRHRLDDFVSPGMLHAIRSGSVAIDDVATHPLTRDRARLYEAMKVRAFANASFARSGRSVVHLAVDDAQPRHWRDDELGLLDKVTARVWPLVERARTQQALRASEATRSLALNAAQLGTVEWDLVAGTMQWNAAQHATFGTDPDTFEPSLDALWSRVHPDDRERLQAMAARAVETGGSCEAEFRVVRADGTMRWCVGGAAVVTDARGASVRVTGVTYDITERRLAEEALKESEERLRHALRAGRMVAWEWSGVSGRMRLSDTAGEVLGVPSAIETMEEALARVHPDDRERLERTIRGAIERGGGYTCEFRAIRPDDGRVIWIEDRGRVALGDDGRPIAASGLILDVTEKVLAEQRARRLASILEATPDFVAIADAEGRLLYVNRAGRRLAGLDDTSESLPPAATLCPAWAAERIVTEWLPRAMEHGVVAAEGALLDVRGREIPVSFVLLVHRSDTGKVEFLSTVARDISERTRIEEALRAADRRKDEFLAMLAHELRNPLAPIRNAVEILKLRASSDPQLAWPRDVIDRQIDHLTRLVDDLLDVSRITRGRIELKKEVVDLVTVVGRAVEASRPLIDARKQHLEIALPSEPLRVEGDVTRLSQVLSNLLHNAAKYTEEGGHVWLRAEREADEVVLRVRDDGMGIAPDVLPHVFELFTQSERTLDRAQGGLGIGLTVVRRLVEMHGGRVEASSGGTGSGSEFTVHLPLVAASSPEGRAPGDDPAEPAPDAANAHRILVVDDNVDAAESMALLLGLCGHVVRTAHDGPSGIQIAREFAPDAVLLDIGLPGMNGYEVAYEMRREPRLRGTILIALTGYGTSEDRARALQAGFDHHLTKPVDPETLDSLIRSLLGG
ncbi:MAG: alpha/beta fold hydrolase [Thermodesulfobacteriota bacterium]